MNFKFNTHNIHLFAYYLRDENENNSDYNEDWLWIKCDEIVAKILKSETDFYINQHLNLKNESDLPREPWANLNKYFPKTDDYHPIYVQPHRYFLEENKEMMDLSSKTAAIYPVQLYDSYGFGLQIISPNNNGKQTINAKDITSINPNNCLILDVKKQNDNFLSQTLLITIKLERGQQLKHKRNKDKLKQIADKYINSLFSNNLRKPPFNRSGYLFGSPVFEYGIIRAYSSYNHIIVQFIEDDKSEQQFDKYYQQLLDLFFFRAKIIHAYRQIRKIEKEAKKKSQEIQSEIKDTQISHDGTLYLDKIQELLIELPQFSVEHAKNLRIIQESQKNIVDNTRNYTDKIYEMMSNFSGEDFSFLELFTKRTCHPFQDRVNAAVQFFQLDTNLINNAIDSIRGQVAIEQARRERQLQTTITSLGIGIAAAGNIASSYESAAPDNGKNHEWGNFGISFGLSTLGGILAGVLTAVLFTQLLHLYQLVVKPRPKK
ncbi:MAG: hypothetical protein MJK14_14585 [Rivularia sp. ALOHA_DT_140]|nr:hypothetical protein [Rivularia sp. ALOHA_DT_140]